MKRLIINPIPCTGCLSCVMVCEQRNAQKADPNAHAISVTLDPFSGVNRIVICRQCQEAACAAQCPKQAIFWDNTLSIWRIDKSLCIRCGTCVRSCPFHAMAWVGDAFGPLKCELCDGYPLCHEACHFGVILFGDPKEQEMKVKGIPIEDLDPRLGRE